MNEIFTWRTKEFENFKKTNDWFWWVGLLSIAGAGIAFWTGSVSFGIFILISGFALILFGNVSHPEHSILITEEGLMIDQSKFLWKDVLGFSIIDDPKDSFGKKVLFETNRAVANKISLPINRSVVNPDALRKFLAQHIEEKEIKESLSKSLAEKIRF